MKADSQMKELADLARYRATELNDWALHAAHFTTTGEWDQLANACQHVKRLNNLLAGYVSQMLPHIKAGDAPEKGKL